MILFFRTPSKSVIAVESNHQLIPDESKTLLAFWRSRDGK